MTETKAKMGYRPGEEKEFPFTAECPICKAMTEGYIDNDDEVMVDKKCDHYLQAGISDDGNEAEDALILFWDDDFEHWFKEVEVLIQNKNLTDLEGYELPKETLQKWFNDNITPTDAAHRIATEGI